MTWRAPRHELVDDQALDDGCVRRMCRCGWSSAPVPAYVWDYDDDSYDAAEAVRNAAWQTHYARLVTPSPFQTLTLGRDRGGRRHYLAGEPVHAGAALDLLLPDGTWWPGRYESAWASELAEPTPTAMFHGGLGGPWIDNRTDTTVQVDFPLPADAVLRWPTREDGR